MAFSKLGFTLFVTLVCATIVVVFTSATASAECQGEQDLISKCAIYVQKFGPKIKPSRTCCDAVLKADFTCVCETVTSETEQIVSMEKAVFVATTCGKTVPHRAKCGSYTIPL